MTSKNIFALVLLVAVILVISDACTHEPFEPKPLPPGTPDTVVTTIDTNDSTDTVNQGDPCHPDTIYFQRDVLPILVGSCGISGCHDDATAQNNVILTNYQTTMSSDVVKAGDPDGSDLFERIVEDDQDKIMPPPPAQKLSLNEITTIRKWILQGALDLYCDELCDTTDYSYSGFVEPLMQQWCTGCHNSSSASGGVDVSVYSSIKDVADDGRLYGALNHEAGFKAMPQGGAKLPDCDIEKVRLWIEAGAPNN